MRARPRVRARARVCVSCTYSINLKMPQNAFEGQALPGPVGGAYNAPRPHNWNKGKGITAQGKEKGIEKKVKAMGRVTVVKREKEKRWRYEVSLPNLTYATEQYDIIREGIFKARL